MPTQEAQHARRQRLLLLLLAAGTASIGLTLALADDAHASDRDHTGPVAGTLSAVTDTTQLLTPADAHPQRQPATPAATRPAASPKPVKRAVGHITDRAGETLDHAKTTTRHIAEGSSNLAPAVGDLVQHATEPVDQIIDQIIDPITAPPPPELPLRGVTTPPTTGSPTPAAPKTAPEPAANNPPLVTAGSGATNQPMHPAAGKPTHRTAASTTTARQQATTASTHHPHHRRCDNGGHHDSAAAVTGSCQHAAAPTERWTGPRTNTSPAHGGARAHTGRTHPPSPPTG